MNPNTDGIDHINVYSKGKTELGRNLSNFAHTPFRLHNITFASVEGFWYWNILITHHKYKEANIVSSKFGYDAKKYGRSFKYSLGWPSRSHLKLAYLAKLEYNPKIREELLKNNLPFAHYYVFNGKVVSADKWLWTAELWTEIANDLLWIWPNT